MLADPDNKAPSALIKARSSKRVRNSVFAMSFPQRGIKTVAASDGIMQKTKEVAKL